MGCSRILRKWRCRCAWALTHSSLRHIFRCDSRLPRSHALPECSPPTLPFVGHILRRRCRSLVRMLIQNLLLNFTTTVHVILGGGGGIGSAVARLLTRDGAKVIVASRDKSKLEKVSLRQRRCLRECLKSFRWQKQLALLR